MPITTQTNFQVDAQLPRFEFDVVDDITARDAIPSINRFEGLESYVKSDQTKYRLESWIDNANWVETWGSSNTFENGLTDAAGLVKLGGPLTETTNITPAAGAEINFGVTWSNLNDFNVGSTDGKIGSSLFPGAVPETQHYWGFTEVGSRIDLPAGGGLIRQRLTSGLSYSISAQSWGISRSFTLDDAGIEFQSWDPNRFFEIVNATDSIEFSTDLNGRFFIGDSVDITSRSASLQFQNDPGVEDLTPYLKYDDSVRGGSGESSLIIPSNSNATYSSMTILDTFRETGLKAAADYSANFDALSYITKGYADATYGGWSSNTFENGLTESGGVVKLGWDLTGPTIIWGNSNFLTIGSAISPLPFLESNWDFWIHTANNSGGTPTTMSYSGQGIILNLWNSGSGNGGSFWVTTNAFSYFGDNGNWTSSTLNVNSSETTMIANNGTSISTIRNSASDGFEIETTSNKGALYISDYSANFVDESLISKRYSDKYKWGRYTDNAGSTDINQATDSLVAFGSTTIQNTDFVTAAAGGTSFTINKAGIYRINYAVNATAAGATDKKLQASVTQNLVKIGDSESAAFSDATGQMTVAGTYCGQFAQGDSIFLQVQGIWASAGSETVLTDVNQSYLAIEFAGN